MGKTGVSPSARAQRDPTMVKDLEREASEFYQSTLLPINERMLGPLPQSENVTSRPMVLLLGNHSSGKSTFINYMLQSDIQKSGVAPTDDSFTLITSGKDDTDQDGPALVGDPDLGFKGLRNFGNSFVSHVNLKVRRDIAVKNVILVDSPGMIDCPAANKSNRGYSGIATMSEAVSHDRGYNFMKVARWFAEQSDVILLFFDPDKPGTTGETLECLTDALQGMDHKMAIIFNKCDQFTKMHDFARAYGSLCWNLSKVIPRKDLPPIYTTCTPVEGLKKGLGEEGLADLNATRTEVLNMVKNAQERRLDNMITRLDDSTRLLQMYAWVCNTVRSKVSAVWWRVHLQAAVMVAGAGGLAAAVYTGRGHLVSRLGERGESAWGWCLGGGGLLSGVYYLLSLPLIAKKRNATSEEELTELFQANYRMEIANGDESLLSLWSRVMPRVQLAMRTVGIDSIGKATRQDTEKLSRIIKEDVPRLRRQFARAIGDPAAL